ncbi:PLP-dependent aminotransferase family protein [Paenibacillus flagellatus]|uniref:PLP-dependent aminotransferase family protein n=1 Tax=Paenibacillus flagellatus TaxID=2211139 RepID=A0A2V5K8F4_9BACL|nr:PLP-dependent aminotransferase family protein [Paenibacillus flagellatus]PYI55789.1 PLP-dependent aminotransferase family protein [Paenibacillus flagellatus]
MNISIDRDSPVPIYRQIKRQIRDKIDAGLLAPGFRLPPERKLAELLAVNRSTVLSAYDELKAEGAVESYVGRGTIVRSSERRDNGERPHEAERPSAPAPLYWKPLLAPGAGGGGSSLIRDLLALPKRPDAVSFGVGVPAPDEELKAELADIAGKLFREGGDESTLLHSPVEGFASLRQTLCERMSRSGIRTTKEEVLVVSGAQQGLDLIARTLLSRGDCVLVEEPTYFSALETFRAAGADVIGIPADADGRLRLDALEAMLRYRPKFVYVIPSYQNPSGRLMDASTREALLHLAYRHRTPIVEEDPYSALGYEGAPLPPIKAMDLYDHVVYVGTFSKLIGPGFRVGWIAAPRQLAKPLAAMKQIADLHTGSIAQKLAESALREGVVDRQTDKIRVAYREKRDEIVSALKQYAVPGMSWETPKGGLFVWVRLPDGVNGSGLAVRASDRGVDYIPGTPFFADPPHADYIRLNFACVDMGRIREGVRRLCAAVQDVLGEERPDDLPGEPGTIPIV